MASQGYLDDATVETHLGGKIIATSHDRWWFSNGNHLISGKSRLVKYYNLPSSGWWFQIFLIFFILGEDDPI